MSRSERKQLVPITLANTGVLLVVMSFVLPYLLGGRSAWTENLAVQFQQASATYHDAIHARIHSHHDPASNPEPSFESARDDYARVQAELEAAQHRGESTARILYWAGLILFATGAAVYVWPRVHG